MYAIRSYYAGAHTLPGPAAAVRRRAARIGQVTRRLACTGTYSSRRAPGSPLRRRASGACRCAPRSCPGRAPSARSRLPASGRRGERADHLRPDRHAVYAGGLRVVGHLHLHQSVELVPLAAHNHTERRQEDDAYSDQLYDERLYDRVRRADGHRLHLGAAGAHTLPGPAAAVRRRAARIGLV